MLTVAYSASQILTSSFLPEVCSFLLKKIYQLLFFLEKFGAVCSLEWTAPPCWAMCTVPARSPAVLEQRSSGVRALTWGNGNPGPKQHAIRAVLFPWASQHLSLCGSSCVYYFPWLLTQQDIDKWLLSLIPHEEKAFCGFAQFWLWVPANISWHYSRPRWGMRRRKTLSWNL